MAEKPIYGLTPIHPLPTARLDDASLSAIRQIIREEIRQALAEEAEADAARPEPRIVTVSHVTDEPAYYMSTSTAYEGPFIKGS